MLGRPSRPPLPWRRAVARAPCGARLADPECRRAAHDTLPHPIPPYPLFALVRSSILQSVAFLRLAPIPRVLTAARPPVPLAPALLCRAVGCRLISPRSVATAWNPPPLSRPHLQSRCTLCTPASRTPSDRVIPQSAPPLRPHLPPTPLTLHQGMRPAPHPPPPLPPRPLHAPPTHLRPATLQSAHVVPAEGRAGDPPRSTPLCGLILPQSFCCTQRECSPMPRPPRPPSAAGPRFRPSLHSFRTGLRLNGAPLRLLPLLAAPRALARTHATERETSS